MQPGKKNVNDNHTFLASVKVKRQRLNRFMFYVHDDVTEVWMTLIFTLNKDLTCQRRWFIS